MALADLTAVKKRLIQLLNANPGTWSASVSGDVGAFFSDEELTQACLEADEWIATRGYFPSVNGRLSVAFEVTSSPLSDGGDLPFGHGDLSKVEVAKSVNALTQASITVGTDLVATPTAHGLSTGDIVTWLLVSGALPTTSPVFVANTNYYAVVISTTTLKLARTLADALAGVVADITVAPTGVYLLIGWQIGVEAANLDDITNAVASGDAYVGAGSFDFLYKEDDGIMYSPATYTRVVYPSYTRTAALQCNQNEEFLVIATAVRFLFKNASPAPFTPWTNESERGVQELVTDGHYSAQVEAQQ